jgi:hypothetical protein
MLVMNTQTVIEDLWMPLLMGLGVFVLGALLWRSLDPNNKLKPRDYRILFLVAAFISWVLYGVIGRKYWDDLQHFSRLLTWAAIAVFSAWGGIMTVGTVRLIIESRFAQNGTASGIIAPPSRALRIWRIAVILWGALGLLGAAVVLLKRI